MKLYNNFIEAIESVRTQLLNRGKVVNTEKWQGIKAPQPMFEAFEISFSSFMGTNLDILRDEVKPQLPWADVHFEERVSGLPLNPGESYKIWPTYGQDDKMRRDKVFDHTYMERYYPKYAGNILGARIKQPIHTDKEIYQEIELFQTENKKTINSIPNFGIRYYYGDLDDVMNLLIREPFTRQAYLPIFFPEDTGSIFGGRVPCTLGYLFTQREGYLHITYYIRSCDYLRHFRDDIYLTVRLVYWMLERMGEKSEFWRNVKPGIFTMHMASLHCFAIEKPKIEKHG